MEIPVKTDNSLKAAVLLARLLLSAAEDDRTFLLSDHGVRVLGNGIGYIYEGEVLTAHDVMLGSMMICRGVLTDLALAMEVEMVDVCRLLELFTAATEVMNTIDLTPQMFEVTPES